jgi:hypothetical protein
MPKIISATLLIAALFAILPALDRTDVAFAQQKRGPNGEKCDSFGTERRNGKDQDGNTVNCLFDSCSFLECQTSGSTISGCVRKTVYSNARDCRAARKTNPTQLTPQTRPLFNKK